jgi:hypothetical protein
MAVLLAGISLPKGQLCSVRGFTTGLLNTAKYFIFLRLWEFANLSRCSGTPLAFEGAYLSRLQ